MPTASIEQIQEAAKGANAHDFIMTFPDGYNTQVGEKGAQLSGGKKYSHAEKNNFFRSKTENCDCKSDIEKPQDFIIRRSYKVKREKNFKLNLFCL